MCAGRCSLHAQPLALEGRLVAVGVVDGDTETKARQFNRDAAAYSARSARDESNLWIHGHGQFRFNGKKGIRSSCSPPCIRLPAGAFRVVNSGSISRKRRFLGPFWGVVLSSFASKTSSF